MAQSGDIPYVAFYLRYFERGNRLTLISHPFILFATTRGE